MDFPRIELRIGSRRVTETERPNQPIINPATGETLGRLPIARESDLDDAIDEAAQAFPIWSGKTPWQRGMILHDAARQVRQRIGDIAHTIVLENGKPVAEANAEVAAAADTLEWYGEEARRIYGRSYAGRAPDSHFMTVREPVGVVAIFAPWNFPVVTLVRKLAPALAAGCTIVAKPSEETPASPSLLAACLATAGLPDGALNLIFGDPPQISRHLIDSPRIAKISFTGSTAVGRQLARQAGGQLKRMTMELGGHGPAIICGDVDPIWAADMAVAAKFRNAGQVCNAASRFIVDHRIYPAFVARFAEAAAALTVGNGFEPQVSMGPLSNQRRIDDMENLTIDAIRHGARLLTGGIRLNRPGYFFAPTVFADVPQGARIMHDEPFGPIAPIVAFETVDEALTIANATRYGLAGYVLTRDLHLARKLTHGLQVGIIGINTFAAAFPEAPFGGIKDSGWGAEGGSEGIEPYLTTKFMHQA